MPVMLFMFAEIIIALYGLDVVMPVMLFMFAEKYNGIVRA